VIKRSFLKIIATSIVFLSPQSYALENKVKLGGVLEVQSVLYKSNGHSSQQIVSRNNKHFGLYSSGNTFVDYQLVTDDSIKYGVKIGLELTAANDRGVPLALYTETNLGKIEIGSDKSAGQKMKITGYAASCATGNGWNSRIKSSPSHGLIGYVTSFCSFLDSKMRTTYKVEYSRKITYYTPKINLNESNEIQIGISYVPDSSNMGYGSVDEDARHTPVSASKYAFVIKDGVSYGVSHDIKLSDQLNIRTSFVGERGTPIAFSKETKKKADVKFKNLNTYVIGTEIKYGSYNFSSSYGNYNKSITSSQIDLIGRDSYVYGASAKYTFGQYATSVSYFGSNYKKNTFTSTSIGLDYLITSGVKSYVQTTYYQAKGKYFDNAILKYHKSTGALIIVGMKVNI
jgi:hypothetical protein